MATSIRAAVAYADGRLRVETATLDDPRDDEARVRVDACGVCFTDAEARHLVPLPAVFGHEGAGIVEAVGPAVSDVQVGDRVIVCYPFCGACPNCDAGRPFHCDHILDLKFGGHRADGSRPIAVDGRPVASAFFQQSTFATHANVPARDLVVVDGDEAPAVLAALPCGVLTGAGSIVNVLRAGPDDALVVTGAGAVGLAAVMAARRARVRRIVAIDLHRGRLELARELGAHDVLDGRDPELASRLAALEPRGFTLAFDTTGRAPVIETLVRRLARGAQLALVTTPPPAAAPPFPLEEFFLRVATLRTVFVGAAIPRQFIPMLLGWHRAGEFPFDRLVRTYPFDAIEQAFGDAAAGTAIKPVLVMR